MAQYQYASEFAPELHGMLAGLSPEYSALLVQKARTIFLQAGTIMLREAFGMRPSASALAVLHEADYLAAFRAAHVRVVSDEVELLRPYADNGAVPAVKHVRPRPPHYDQLQDAITAELGQGAKGVRHIGWYLQGMAGAIIDLRLATVPDLLPEQLNPADFGGITTAYHAEVLLPAYTRRPVSTG